MIYTNDYRKKVGDFGQKLAKKYLISKGFEVIAQNYYIKGGEIDLIVRKNNKIGFVEVKTRTNLIYGEPEDAIDVYKLIHLNRAAEVYLKEKKIMNEVEVEISVIAIKIDKEKRRAWLKFYQDIGTEF